MIKTRMLQYRSTFYPIISLPLHSACIREIYNYIKIGEGI